MLLSFFMCLLFLLHLYFFGSVFVDLFAIFILHMICVKCSLDFVLFYEILTTVSDLRGSSCRYRLKSDKNRPSFDQPLTTVSDLCGSKLPESKYLKIRQRSQRLNPPTKRSSVLGYLFDVLLVPFWMVVIFL